MGARTRHTAELEAERVRAHDAAHALENAREQGFDDCEQRARVMAGASTVCEEANRIKAEALPCLNLTVEHDAGAVEVNVPKDARVADVLAVACTELRKPIPRSTLSFGGGNLQTLMGEKLSDVDVEAEAVLRLVQLMNGEVNRVALEVLAMTPSPSPACCRCAIM